MEIKEFQLERYLAKYEFSAPYLLCTSDCETFSISRLLALEDGSQEKFLDLILGYTESQGSPSLRNEIAAWYETVTSDQVVVTSGAEEAIFIAMQVLLKPGDHVIVQTPSYQSLHEIPRAIGCQVSPWVMSEKDGTWQIDLDVLGELISPVTKALIINSPHNPTGHLCSAEEWRSINELCDDHSISILSDEVYRGIEHNPASCLPAMVDVTDNGFSLGVMSKALGLAGLRIGWIASKDTDFIHRFLAFKDYTTICNSAPSEFLATVALRQKEKILQRNREIIHTNLQVLDEFFSRHQGQISWSRPDAGSTAFPRISSGMSADKFCELARVESGVLLLPGTVFGVESSHFRIGYGRRNMPEVLAKLENILDNM